MTRRDQVCRSWISRKHPGLPFKSHVSIAGTLHTLSTGTRIRRAAREFNRLHLTAVLTNRKPPAPPKPTAPELFS